MEIGSCVKCAETFSACGCGSKAAERYEAYEDPITDRQEYKIDELGGKSDGDMTRSEASDYIKKLQGRESGTWRAESGPLPADPRVSPLNTGLYSPSDTPEMAAEGVSKTQVQIEMGDSSGQTEGYRNRIFSVSPIDEGDGSIDYLLDDLETLIEERVAGWNATYNAESFEAESKFDKLAKEIAEEYEEKGKSPKEAMEIGEATAANIGRAKFGKRKFAKMGKKAEDDIDFDKSKADRNKDGRISDWERAVGNKVAKGIRESKRAEDKELTLENLPKDSLLNMIESSKDIITFDGDKEELADMEVWDDFDEENFGTVGEYYQRFIDGVNVSRQSMNLKNLTLENLPKDALLNMIESSKDDIIFYGDKEELADREVWGDFDEENFGTVGEYYQEFIDGVNRSRQKNAESFGAEIGPHVPTRIAATTTPRGVVKTYTSIPAGDGHVIGQFTPDMDYAPSGMYGAESLTSSIEKGFGAVLGIMSGLIVGGFAMGAVSSLSKDDENRE